MTDLRFADPTQLFNAPFTVIIDGEGGIARDAVAVVLAEELEADNATLRASLKRMREERDALTKSGDQMQSALSRVADWALGQSSLTYEVHMAALEGVSAVCAWTTARTALAETETEQS